MLKIRNGLNDHALVEGMDQLHIDIGTAQRRFLSHLAEFDARQRYKPLGHRDTAEWLSARYGYSRHRAKRCVAAAHAIEHLPHIAQALEDGTLNLERVIELTRMATPQDEEQLIPWARRVTAWHIGRRADACEKASRKTKRAHDARFFEWWFNDDATVSLYGQLPTDQGVALATAIDRIADTVPVSPTDAPDPIAQRRADALMALVSQRLASDPDPDRATVVLHTTPEQLASKTHCSELSGGIPVTPRVAQQLACDARVQTVTHAPDGSVGDIAPTTYRVPAYLRRVVLQRDGFTCTFPGCTARRVDIHHMIAHPKGPTLEWNLTAVCRVHHTMTHVHGWQQRLIGGAVQWFRPDGSPYDPMPVRAGPAP